MTKEAKLTTQAAPAEFEEIIHLDETELRALASKGFVFPGKKMDDWTDIGRCTGACNTEGIWVVQGNIDHQSWWCAEYRLGIDFGKMVGGHYVALTRKLYGDWIKHCNGEMLHHHNSGNESQVASNFASITSARRWVQRR